MLMWERTCDRRRRNLFSLFRWAIPLGFAVTLHAQVPETDVQKNPFPPTPATIAAGQKLYQQTCQACHGSEARGDRGPALAAGNLRHGSEGNDIFRTIRTGVPGTHMAGFSL